MTPSHPPPHSEGGPVLGEIGELDLIRRLRRLLPSSDSVSLDIGDDVALVSAGSDEDWALTTDPVIEGSHFLADTPAEQVGHKAVGRVLSDLAAVGADPAWLLIDVAAPKATPVARVEGAYRGAAALAESFGAAIVGGDCAGAPAFELHVFGIGRLPRGSALLRSAARPGQALYVTGALGGSLAGKHLSFEPRVREGAWLRQEGWAGALMDVSDGLATDTRHILAASNAGADLDAAAIPISGAARAMDDDRSPLQHALRDGEDFELLFTVEAERTGDFEDAWAKAHEVACHRIGTVTGNPGVLRLCHPDGRAETLDIAGFEHFRA